ncbi:hypothetical protein AJ80_06573 [Polytolypa hystricis UAMH7299]|uniref:beta-galactosidase n=1 Tax=Polytolypa hystricis (strain UAMH7299) TaxID=1447883 RepID=A0A2B7XM77_POLH7|nr:hypothetical protein AJ80_06573 [Polytolypa hystricis UAMH7299]
MELLKSWVRVWALFTIVVALVGNAIAQDVTEYPLHDNGLNKVVQWDHYSFKVNGQRLFVFSGELHYWRIPVPEVWEDLLEKIKAAGFTAFATYSHWGYHSPNPSTLDFESGAHDFTPLLKIAKKVGLYAIIRPGPYVNAEANAGGFPNWLVTGEYGTLRNNDSRYTDAWTPFFSKYSEIVSNHLVTNDGTTFMYQIENEYGEQWVGSPTDKVPNPTAAAYMELLQENARDNGIDVPLLANDPNMYVRSWSKDYSDARGNVDVYGVDSYPSCWSCNLDECTGTNGEYVAYKVMNYYDHFEQVSPTQPEFLPEFQGGSYNPWGGPEGGCPDDIGADFANLFYRDNIGQRVTAISLYMMYGGTNWGYLGCPVVATSYDYSSPISENRALWAKYYETKNLALFTRAATDLTVTDRLGNNTDYTTNKAVLGVELRNPETKAAFYVTRHADSSSSTVESFKLRVRTSVGNLTIPQQGHDIVLNGHQSKILVTDFAFGKHHLVYSTAEVLTYAVFGNTAVLALWVPTGESAEFYIKGGKRCTKEKGQGSSNIKISRARDGVIVSLKQGVGMSVFSIDRDIRVIVLDRSYSYLTWAPTLSPDPFGRADDLVLVQGPYLVREARLSKHGHTLDIKGDVDKTTNIEIFAPSSAKRISWNGKVVKAERTSYGSLTAKLPGPDASSIKLPALKSWKKKDSLPERFAEYDDSGFTWVAADHTETPNPRKPDTLPVLYADDYGFHNGIHLWRGSFTGDKVTGVHLSLQGGYAFGWSAWLNGEFIGSYLGGAYDSTGNLTLSFANATLHSDGKKANVLFVIQDDNGHELRAEATEPRGILSAYLISEGGGKTEFSSWRTTGTAGGEDTILDPIRGAYNEGGLFGERLGWHLPEFSVDSTWNSTDTLSVAEPGVHFFLTTARLSIPQGLDVAISFKLSTPSNKNKLRAMLFVNGYQYGRFNPYIGHQTAYPVPPGVLNYSGENTIGVVVWAQSVEGAELKVEWAADYVLESSFVSSFDGAYLRPAWEENRLSYA